MNDKQLMTLLEQRVSGIKRIVNIVRGSAGENLITETALVFCHSLISAIEDLRHAIQRYNKTLGDTVLADTSRITEACLAQAGCHQDLEQSARHFAHLLAQFLACFCTPVDENSDGISEPAAFRTTFMFNEQNVRICVHIDQHELMFCEYYR